jgi:hypothetical protein
VGTEQVDWEFFHVTRTLPYNPNGPLSLGQTIRVGDQHNPFFAFFEGVRQYGVTTPSGLVQVKAIKYLKSVQRGEIHSFEFPRIAAEVAEHYLILARELILEEVRREIAPSVPSRKTCLWVADSASEAREWQKRLGGNSKIARLQASGHVHRADASLLLGDSEPLSLTYTRANSYWRGEFSEIPELETLFSGSARVVEII